MPDLTPFHLAFPVHDLEVAREFYRDGLGCAQGRESDHWIDFDLHGHQIVAHHKEGMQPEVAHNEVDGDAVPVPHFGVVLRMEEWEAMAERLKGRSDTKWVIEPRVRFKGEPGEQATFFILDPSGNALEFKAFRDMKALFAT